MPYKGQVLRLSVPYWLPGFWLKIEGISNQEILALMFGLCFWGAFVEIILSQFVNKLKSIITPLTTGNVITTIGITLIKVGMTDFSGECGVADFAAPQDLLMCATVPIMVIVINASKHPMLRLSTIFIGMFVDLLLARWQGMLSFDNMLELPLMSIPQPFKF